MSLDDSPVWTGSQRLVAFVYVVAVFVNILDGAVVNTAIPTLTEEFELATTSANWVVTSYFLSLAVAIPCAGWLGDHFTTKRVFTWSIGGFTAASVVCAMAGTFPVLVVGRLLQGLSAGAMLPVATAMLFRTFGAELRAKAASVVVLPAALGPTIGPVFGGYLVEHLSWRWIFVVNLPIGAAAMFGSMFLEPLPATDQRRRLDVGGLLLSSLSLGLVLFTISEAPVLGWDSPLIAAALVIGGIATALLIPHQLRRPNPLIDLALLRNRLFRTSNLLCFFAYAAFLGLLYAMPLYVQEAGSSSPFESGLTTFPDALGVMIFSQVAARAYHSIGPRRLLVGGLALLTVLLVFISQRVGPESIWSIRVVMFLAGGCFAFVVIPQQAATFTTIDDQAMNRASSLFMVQRQVAAAVGISLVAATLAMQVNSSASLSRNDFRAVFLVLAGLTLVGALISSTIRDGDATASMAPRSRTAVHRPERRSRERRLTRRRP